MWDEISLKSEDPSHKELSEIVFPIVINGLLKTSPIYSQPLINVKIHELERILLVELPPPGGTIL